MPGIIDTILNPANAIGSLFKSVIGTFVTDPTKKAELEAQLAASQAELEAKAMELDAQLADAKQKVIVAEAQGNWMQRSWRPMLMFTFMAILVNNFILSPYLRSFGLHVVSLDMPPEGWTLLTVGVGGYIASRGVEKVKGAD